ncbi:MAG TPA: cyclic nucleotide-binding domain-containing protein, partial [Vicinamibacterales bacterium]
MAEPGILDELPLLRFVPDEVRAQVVQRFVPVSFPFGGVLVAEGDEADALYVLVTGRARVVKRTDQNDEIPLGVLYAGDSFGETELLQGRPYPTTLRASSDVLALRLDRAAFDALVEAEPYVRTYLELQLKHGTIQRFFRDFPAFTRLSSEAMVGVVLAELEPRAAAAGDVIFAEGDPPGPLYLIEEGRVRAMRRTDGAAAYLGSFGPGEYFGELAALNGTPRTSSVEALAPCRLLSLGPDTVQRLADALPEFRARLEERDPNAAERPRLDVPAGLEQELLPAGARVQVQADDTQVTPGAEATDGDEAPFEDGGRFVKSRRRRRRMRFVRQIDEMDCGAASLAMVTRSFGRQVSLARIRQLVNT